MVAEPDSSEITRQTKVLVCTSEMIFEGNFSCNISQRLIDALNEGVRENQMSRLVNFLSMTDVTIWDVNGKVRKTERIYVAKNNVIFVAQKSSDAEDKRLSSYPYRKKLAAGVTIYAAQAIMSQKCAVPYILKGQLYVETWGQVADTIETEDMFLPMTQVEIEPAPAGQGRTFDFVAVNKARIISICEGEAGSF